jgi:hypothetical protein
MVSDLNIESKSLESSGRDSRQNSYFLTILAIFGSISLKEEILSIVFFYT